MVFFSCNACGQAVKKNQVDKHYQTQCPRCEVLSCMDCGKDFWGDEYKKHIKCVSEEEKYSGMNYKPKSNVNKGEAKQEQWIQRLHEVISNTKANPELKQLLEQLTLFTNIPRKKPKFLNFLKNSVRLRKEETAHQAWDIFFAAQKNNEVKTAAESQVDSTEPTNDSTNHEKKDNTQIKDNEVKLDRKRKKNSKDSSSKKKARTEDICGNSESQNTVVDDMSAGDDTNDVNVVDGCEQKFKCITIVKKLLKSADDHELSLKKLKKKVKAEHSLYGGHKDAFENVWLKFEKKIQKNRKFRVHKEKVKLL